MREKLPDARQLGILTSAQLESDGATTWRSRKALVLAGAYERAGPDLFVRPETFDDPRLEWWRDALLLLMRTMPGSRFSRQCAAALWGLDGFEPPVAISVDVDRHRRARMANVHHPRTPRPAAWSAGLPVTDAVTTMVEMGAGLGPRNRWAGDLRPIAPIDLVELAVESALRLGLVDLIALADGASPAGWAPTLLAQVLDRRPVDAPPTESYLETRAVQLFREGNLPDPERQVVIRDERGQFVARVDFRFGGTVVECDGREHHAREGSFERDRERWDRLQALGLRPMVFTYDHIERKRRRTLDLLGQTMSLAA